MKTLTDKFGIYFLRREILPAKPDGSVPEVITNNYFVSFDESKIDLANFESVAAGQGRQGRYVFSSVRAAKVFKHILELTALRGKLGISSVGLNGWGETSFTTTEGKLNDTGANQVSPGGIGYCLWFQNVFNSSTGNFGSYINSTGWSAWSYADGSGVNVAVIDTGFINSGEAISTNTQMFGNLANGGSVYGWNLDTNTNVISVGGGHGRAVSSIIFNNINDSYGTAGVAYRATPMLFHVDSSQMSEVAAAIDLARSWGAKIVNVSMQFYDVGGNGTTLALYQPVVNAANANMIVVGASGNYGTQYGAAYPGGYYDAINVSAYDTNGNLSVFGTGGPGNTANTSAVDVYAAGTNVAVATNASYPNIGVQGGNGTSASAPIVAGALALYYQRRRSTG